MNRPSIQIIISLLLLSLVTCQQLNFDNYKSSFERTYPQVFMAWSGIENRDNENELTRIAYHNLVWHNADGILDMQWQTNEPHPHQGLATQLDPSKFIEAISRLNAIRASNPNTKILCVIGYHDDYAVKSSLETGNIWENGYFPDDSPYWLRDEIGNLIICWGEDTNGDGKVDENDTILTYFIDFSNEDVQNIIADKALALKNSGLFDGIFMDWWSEQGSTTKNMLTSEQELNARLAILQKIRAKVGNDFLIIVNNLSSQLPNSAPYINGVFLEGWKQYYDQSYTVSEILTIENKLIWAEDAPMLTPSINCLEGWRKVTDYDGDKETRVAERDSPENTQMMRLFTTMSLTLSDGCVLFGDDNHEPSWDHLHNWYSFWDISLGNPISQKNQKYNDIDGLLIREYEKGWAVYNRSGSSQHITFTSPVTGVTGTITSTDQDIQDMDGEIYLKSLPKAG